MNTHPRLFRSMSSGIAGLTLLLPASYFMLTMTARIFGAKNPYFAYTLIQHIRY